MRKVYIWGTGVRGREVLDTLNQRECLIAGFIDNDPAKQGGVFENQRIYAFSEISDDYDYIVIAVIRYESVLYQLQSHGFDMSRAILYYADFESEKREYEEIFDRKAWKIAVLEQKIRRLETMVNIRFNNIGFEIADKIRKGSYCFPRLGDTREAIDRIVNQGCSLVRFGDGEFEIMAERERPVFQRCDPGLARRLKEIIQVDHEKLLIGIADNYGDLDAYSEETADGIRMYMTRDVRNSHWSVLKRDKVYYDAYLFKAYYPFQDKAAAEERISNIKRIWDGRDVVIVEGDKTRTGYGNELFDNVKSLRRILGPTQNAFDRYDEILRAGLNLSRESLILAAMGPVAELLVYDLMVNGYQAVDIGQIDMDYEWYLAGAKAKVPINHKYVSQLPPAQVEDLEDEVYRNQIIASIL